MKKIFVWSRWIDDVVLGTKPPVAQGGAELQMSFWAKLFAEKGYKVYTFSWRNRVKYKKILGVNFLWIPWMKKIGVLFLPMKYIYLTIFHPDLVMVRSHNDLKFLVSVKKLLGFRIIYMLASDKNVMLCEDSINNVWQRYLRCVDIIVTQNEYQYLNIKSFFPDKSSNTIIIPNIFDKDFFNLQTSDNKYDFIWVGNVKKNKRISWFLSMAERMPKYSFAIIGAIQDETEGQELLSYTRKCQNISYLGYMDVHSTTKLISNSSILVSTSETEGFPNTFLQAWSYNIPVISTVDPSNVILNYFLGYVVNSIDELIIRAVYLVKSDITYSQIQKNISDYFDKSHSPYEGFRVIESVL